MVVTEVVERRVVLGHSLLRLSLSLGLAVVARLVVKVVMGVGRLDIRNLIALTVWLQWCPPLGGEVLYTTGGGCVCHPPSTC